VWTGDRQVQRCGQLNRDAGTISFLPQGSVDDVTCAQLRHQPFKVQRLAHAAQSSAAANDQQMAEARERGGDIIDETVDKTVLLGIR